MGINAAIEFDFLCDTLLHISEVAENLEEYAGELRRRGLAHDRTKLQEPEFSAFIGQRERFKKANYGTPEYEECMRIAKPAVDHHYQHNRHHTAFVANGINDMGLIDILEMVADWRAANRRSPDKELVDTLDYMQKKYGIGEQLMHILRNTLELA